MGQSTQPHRCRSTSQVVPVSCTGTLERCAARHFRQHFSRDGGRLVSLYHYFAQWAHSCLTVDCSMALCHLSLAVKWPRGKREERLACASPVKRLRHQVRVPVCGGVSHACHVLSQQIVEFCEKCCLLICTSLTRRRITEGEMRARFQSHTITRRRAGRGTAKLAAENQTKLAES